MTTSRTYYQSTRAITHRVYLDVEGRPRAYQTIQRWVSFGPTCEQQNGPIEYERGFETAPLYLAPEVWTFEESSLFDRWRANGGRYT